MRIIETNEVRTVLVRKGIIETTLVECDMSSQPRYEPHYKIDFEDISKQMGKLQTEGILDRDMLIEIYIPKGTFIYGLKFAEIKK